MHIVLKQALSRRAVLRGAGAALALPWLEAMAPALRRRAEPAVRHVFVFAPNGKKMDDWRPTSTDDDFALPFLLEPLAPWRRDLLVLGNMTLDGGRAHGDGPGDHARAAASFLTGAHPKKTGGADLHCGVSVDQALAQLAGSEPRFPSLELGMEGGRSAGECDSGYSCAYSNNIAWRSPTTPVAKETDPRAVFARLFGDPGVVLDAEARARARATERSILDAVRGDARRLAQRLGPPDEGRLDEYLDAVRAVEQRLEEKEAAPAVELPAGLRNPQRSLPGKLRLMYDMLALALRADLTRVVTFMLGNAGSNKSYRFLDVPEGHHDLSHHGGQADKLAKVRAINRFHVEEFARFVGSLADIDEGGVRLLDRAIVMYGSGLADGNSHAHHDLPIILVGGGGGTVRGGRHIRAASQIPLANVYLTLLQNAGSSSDRFADSTGPFALR